jgi:hypothetical protein
LVTSPDSYFGSRMPGTASSTSAVSVNRPSRVRFLALDLVLFLLAYRTFILFKN